MHYAQKRDFLSIQLGGISMKHLMFSILRPLQNLFFRHSGLDPESRKSLKPLDSGLRRNDDITTFVKSYEGLILFAVFISILIFTFPAVAQQSCEGLKSIKIPNVTITSVEKGSPGCELPGQTGAGFMDMPPQKINAPFCRIKAVSKPTSDSHIGIEVWLPDASNWNGRFLAVGNPGFIGSIASGGIARNMERGYVSAGTDTGHVDQGFEWAIGHPEK
jgi:hypothetical protein